MNIITCQYYCFFLFFLRTLPNNTFYLKAFETKLYETENLYIFLL